MGFLILPLVLLVLVSSAASLLWFIYTQYKKERAYIEHIQNLIRDHSEWLRDRLANNCRTHNWKKEGF
jgi:hypothetical protein